MTLMCDPTVARFVLIRVLAKGTIQTDECYRWEISSSLYATWCGQSINPANGGVDPLLLLTCATLPMGKNGCLLHARLRYFDPVRSLRPRLSFVLNCCDSSIQTLSSDCVIVWTVCTARRVATGLRGTH